MELTILFGVTGVIIFVGFFGEWVFEKTKIPDVLWLMIVGIFLNHAFKLSQNLVLVSLGPIFTTFALIFILFEGVLSVNIKKLMSGVVEGGNLSMLHFIFTMIFVAFAMMIAGWGFLEGLLLGAILGDSSQAVIIPLMKKIAIQARTALIITFETAISDVFCIVGALTIINIILIKSFSLEVVLQKIVYSFAFAILIGIIVGLVWIKLLSFINKSVKPYLITIGALLLLYSFVEYLGASGPLACLAFGILVGNSRQIGELLKKESGYNMGNYAKFLYSEISFFLKTFFFVYLGLIISLENVGLIVIGFMLSFLIFLIRPLSVVISHKNKDFDKKQRIYLEILNPKGLSAAVLATIPAQYGMPHGNEFSTIVMSAIISSVLLTIIALFLTEKNRFNGIWYLLRLNFLGNYIKNKFIKKPELSLNKESPK